ncbi:sensor histidine kinase [Taibaiella soli]|uniref:histidine kinase n=1 Tax=Taibaiella soli TaxID=1649169 RepID=A0A2W2ATZ0_9BACT|nr:HAMP domain-containing sensor histidine kinase [Taibaiella soli]PZF71178.1 hypothetical protein DN068_19575 [Taibaiella soli]
MKVTARHINLFPVFFMLLLLQTWSIISSGQSVQGNGGKSYFLQQYTDENGLLQNSVTDMLPDKAGFLWLATQSGIQRFDGAQFYTPEHNRSDVSGFLNRIWSLYYKGDTLLAQTTDLQLIYIYASRIVKITPLNFDSIGVLLLNSKIGKLNSYAVLKQSVNFKRQNGLEGYTLGDQLATDTIVEVSQAHMDWYNAAGLFKEIPIQTTKEVNTLFKPPYVVYFRDDGMLQVYNAKGALVSEQMGPEKHNEDTKVVVSKNPDVMGYYAIGSTVFSVALNKEHHVVFDTVLSQFPRALLLSAIWKKDEFTLVGSSASQGLFVFHTVPFTTLLPPASEDIQAVFYGQAFFPNNSTILSGRGLLFRNGAYIGVEPSLQNAASFTFMTDRSGSLWYSIRGTVYRRTPDGIAHPVLFVEKGVRAFYQASGGKIWMSDAEGIDIGYIVHDSLHRIKLIGFNDSYHVETFYECPDGLLVGTSGGIYLVKNGTDKGWLLPFAKGKDVRFIEKDGRGNIWCATYGDGLYLYRNGEAIHFPLDVESRLRYVHAAIPDKDFKYLFLPTNHGLLIADYHKMLSYADTKEITPAYVYFDRNYGLHSNEFNGGCNPAYLRLPGGKISLPSMYGLVQFHPDTLARIYATTDSVLYIDNVWVDGVSQNAVRDLNCGPRTQTIQLHVAAPSWTKISGSQMRYSLTTDERFDRPVWLDIPASGFITIPVLSNTHYHLLLRSAFGTEAGMHRFNFAIAPFWYQTTWFLLLIVLGSVLLVFLLFRMRYWSLVRRNRQLESHVRAATADLRATNLQLHRNNVLKNRLLSALSHDIATPLQYIERALISLLRGGDHTNVAVPKADLEDVVDTVVNLECLTDDLVRWSQLQQNADTFSVYNENFLLADLVAEKWKPLRSQAAYKNLSLELIFDARQQLFTDPKLLGIILYNLFSNAIKFSSSGKVMIDVFYSDEKKLCTVAVSDQGKGISQQRLQQINGMLGVSPEKGTNEEGGKGIGLRIVRDLTHALGGSIAIESRQGQGTVVNIHLPAVAFVQRKGMIF